MKTFLHSLVLKIIFCKPLKGCIFIHDITFKLTITHFMSKAKPPKDYNSYLNSPLLHGSPIYHTHAFFNVFNKIIPVKAYKVTLA